MRYLLLCLLLAGCGAYRAAVNADINRSIAVMPLGTGRSRPAVRPESVAVYLSAEQVPERYEEIALFSTTYDPTRNSAVLNALRRQAAERGANGLLLLPSSGPVSASSRVDWFGDVNTSVASRSRLVAIYIGTVTR